MNSHTHTGFSHFIVTFHRRKDVYNELFGSPNPNPCPTPKSTNENLQKTSLSIIYKLFSSWGQKMSPQGQGFRILTSLWGRFVPIT